MLRFKIALAVAIIRQKPPHLTARQHAEKLSAALLTSLQNYDDDQEDVETIAPTDERLISSLKEFGTSKKCCAISPACLRTGSKIPPSIETSCTKTTVVAKSNWQLETFEVENKRFMQGVIGLKAVDFSKSLHKQDDLIRCVSYINNFCQIMSREAFCLPASCLCQAADAIVNIMDVWPSAIEREEFMKAVCDLVDLVLLKLTFVPSGIRKWSSVHRQKVAMAQMLAIFMKSKSTPLTTTILETLLDTWEIFCGGLRSSRRLIQPLDPVVFENSFYIVHCLQLVSKLWLAGHFLDGFFLQETQERLEKSLLHLTDSFPLLSLAVWKVTAAIEKAFQEDNMT